MHLSNILTTALQADYHCEDESTALIMCVFLVCILIVITLIGLRK